MPIELKLGGAKTAEKIVLIECRFENLKDLASLRKSVRLPETQCHQRNAIRGGREFSLVQNLIKTWF